LRPRRTTGDKIAGATGPHLGDIAISFPRARAQARDFGHDTGQEIQILMLHGLLHLLGMDHATDGGRMARAEKRWRARLGLANGLIERVRR
jgi:probable rRNA maturation factor